MKFIFLVSLFAATGLFAAPEATTATANTAAAQAPAAAPAAQATATPAVQTAPAVKDTAKAAPAAQAAPAAKDSAQAAPAAQAAAPAAAKDTAKVAEVKTDTAKAAPVTPVAAAPAAKDTAKAADMDSSKAQAPKTEASSVAAAPAEDNSMAAPGSMPVKKKKQPLFAAGQYVFDVNASCEIPAEKTPWDKEDDVGGDNFDEWWGRANLAFVTQSNDFNGKILVRMYPGDLKGNEYHVRQDSIDKYEYRDLFEVHEAWAKQNVNLQLGRWEFTQKNGDYFGDYLDGYYKGYKSGANSENALQFGLTANENFSAEAAFVSTESHLNKGDLRLMFHFRKLASIEKLDLDLGYRTNVFDRVHDSNSDILHTISLQGKVPLVQDIAYLFLEGAVMDIGITGSFTSTTTEGVTSKHDNDMVTPITGGLLFTPRDYRIILEAEYIHNRKDTQFADANNHVKDVLGAFYIEKPLSDRFTLSFGAHNYASSKDYAFSGNLIGKIN